MNRFSVLLIIVALCGASADGADSASYKLGRSAEATAPSVVSAEQINAVPHPISENKPKRKVHKNPIPKPDWTKGIESFDPANPRHILDRNGDKGARDASGYAPCKSFVGINSTGWDPPDPSVAAGPNHVVEVVNSSIAVFDKNSGAKLLQTTAGFWFASTSPPPASGFIFDPKVVFDPVAQRFIILYLCTDDVSQASFLVSVSQTANAMGSWYNYNFDATVNGDEPANTWPDYPGLGLDYDEAVYLTSNMWTFPGDYLYAKVRVLPKAQLYSGAAVAFTDFWDLRYNNFSVAFTVKPAVTLSDADGEFLLSNIWYGSSYTTYWKITDPLGTPSLELRPQVNVANYPSPPNARQLGGNNVGLLGSMTQDVFYRNGKVYTAFDQAFDWGSGTVAAIRLFGIDTVTSTASIDFVFGADKKDYYFPNIYVDPSDRIFLGYNRSAADEYIGVWCAEEVAPGAGSRVIKAGEGPRGGGSPVRWGDYSGIAGDPDDANNVWICHEFNTSSTSVWRTWIGRVPAKVVAPNLASPINDERARVPVTLTWDLADPAATYILQVDEDTLFASPLIDTTVNANNLSAGNFTGETRYFWRARGVSGCPDNQWSVTQSFVACTFVPGDADASGAVSIADAVYLLNFIFASGAPPNPTMRGDANCDIGLSIADVVYLINYVFSGGPAPCDPC